MAPGHAGHLQLFTGALGLSMVPPAKWQAIGRWHLSAWGKGGHPTLIPVSQEELPWCPCSLEDHGAVLPVEGEVGDMDDTDAAVDGRGQPVDAAIRGHQHVGVEGDLECPIDAGGKRMGSAPNYARGAAASPTWGRVPIALSLTCSPGRCLAARPWWRAPAAAGCRRIP